MLIVEVPGLCVGASVDPRSRDPGYIVFMQSTSKDRSTSSNQIFFEWYYEFVFRKFVNDQRTLYDGRKEGTPVEPELTAVSWNDGDIPQLAACGEVKRIAEYCEARIRTCKQNASLDPGYLRCELWVQLSTIVLLPPAIFGSIKPKGMIWKAWMKQGGGNSYTWGMIRNNA